MKPSLFTPTDNVKFLEATYKSLRNQTVDAWEWVLVTNGGAKIPEAIRADSRVVVHDMPNGNKFGIGALKKMACSKCTGDVLIELDHDDLLAPSTVERVVYHALETGAGFLYSDFVNFAPDGSSQTFDARYGWETYPATLDGDNYTALRAFDPCPRSLHQIFFAPNHVRAWTRDAYAKSGGHDPALPICDDHDLVARTYLKGIEFCHIEEPLYWYRERSGLDKNTYRRSADELTRLRNEVMNRVTRPLCEEWARRHKLQKIDLGGAIGCPAGYTSVDRREGAQVVCDIEEGLPFAENSVGVVRAFDFLEHIRPERVVCVMNEIYRVLAPGGWAHIAVPSTDGRGAFQAPDHRSFWNGNSFNYYCNRDFAKYVPEIACRFQAARLWDSWPTDWHQENKIIYTNADLVALKGQKVPGEILI
jgi:glycosyltransferase involved in cell wall biosynthesis